MADETARVPHYEVYEFKVAGDVLTKLAAIVASFTSDVVIDLSELRPRVGSAKVLIDDVDGPVTIRFVSGY